MTSVSIEVERPAAEVFSYATDPSRFHEWQQGVVSGSMESKGAPAVGDHCRTTRRIGGAERPATSELVRLDPPRAWAVRGIDGPIRAQVDVSVESLTGPAIAAHYRRRLRGTRHRKGAGAARRAQSGSRRDARQPREAQGADRDATDRVIALKLRRP